MDKSIETLIYQKEELEKELARLKKEINMARQINVSNDWFDVSSNDEGKTNIEYQLKYPCVLKMLVSKGLKTPGKRTLVLCKGNNANIADMLETIEMAAKEIKEQLRKGAN